MGYYEETGFLILGTRLKRLSERFLSEVGKVYEKLEIDFEPAWFPMIFLIYKKGSLAITEISEELNVSQPAASQLVSMLYKKGYLLLTADEKDKRRKIVSFSPAGEDIVSELVPVWEMMEKSMYEIFSADEDGNHIVDSFNRLEKELNRISFGDSVLNKLKI